MALRFAALAIVTAAAAGPAAAQRVPPAPRAAHAVITRAPSLELAHDGLAIIRWTASNPGGLDVHFGVVHYGTDPAHLDRVARSPIRLDRGHAMTVFRVRVSGLRPSTTYYYSVSSDDSAGTSDHLESAVSQFTTPTAGARFVAVLGAGDTSPGSSPAPGSGSAASTRSTPSRTTSASSPRR